MLRNFHILILLAGLVGCGLKTKPRSPELDFRPPIPEKKPTVVPAK